MNLEYLFALISTVQREARLNVIHSQQEKRCDCTVCGKTFTITKGTLFYRLRTDPKIVMRVIVLLSYGCPRQAIVKAFGLDKRTVKKWWQAQADEIKAKVQGGYLWLAMAITVQTRLWLGAAVSQRRELALMQALADRHHVHLIWFSHQCAHYSILRRLT